MLNKIEQINESLKSKIKEIKKFIIKLENT